MIKTNYIELQRSFSQAVITEANNIKTIYISGQIGLVPLKQQTIATFQTYKKKLVHCNATLKNVVK
jgi:enamine deaminase RidA (YjgF/YER057c/UK114 family)